MAIITSAQTGDYELTATWVGGVLPVAGDDVVIATTHTVSVTDTRLCTALTIYGNLTVVLGGSLTHSGNILHDPTASGDGIVNIHGGGVLQPSGVGKTWTFDGTNALHAVIKTTSTSISNWARCGNTASGNTVYFLPLAGNTFSDIVEFDCQFMEFWRVDDGSNYFINNGQHGGTVLSNWSMPDCFFNYCGIIRFGAGSNPGADLVVDFRRSDFRNPVRTRIFEYGSNDSFTAYRGLGGATVNGDGSTRHEIYISAQNAAAAEFDVDGVVSQDCRLNNLATAKVSCDDGIWREKLNTTGSVFAQLSSGSGQGSSTFRNNLCQSESDNSHFFSASGTSTTQNTVSGNILFAVDSGDANTLLYSDKLAFTQNVTIGGTGPSTTGGSDNITISRNTTINPGNNGHGGAMFETTAYGGVVDYINNLVVQAGSPLGYIAIALSPIVNQSMGTVGYNGYYNLTGAYSNVVFTTDQTANDINADPQLGNINATFATWDTANGGAGTVDNCINECLKKNGRDSTGTLAAFDTNYSYANGLAYFQDAFAPRNIAYQGTGSGGVDIGALDVVIASGVTAGSLSLLGVGS